MTDETVPDVREEVDLVRQVATIVSAYVSHNAVRAVDMPELIASIHASVRMLRGGAAATVAKAAEAPAVPVKRSVHKDHIVCLEDGKKFKSLRRHLNAFHGLTPEEYRTKWNLPGDYPMVAPAYSATRSRLAKDSGLGQVARPTRAPPQSEPTPAAKPKRRRKASA